MKEENTVKKTKKPWPTKDAMEQIYELNLWGNNGKDFYSGTGSHDLDIVNPYVASVRTFLSSFKTLLTVCDLGCGDFNVGKELVAYTKQYIAIDIVETLVTRNTKKFTAENLKFHCLDIATDNLPAGDCALVRQVLQHLSNAEVQSILNKLANFKYVILTEHLPEGSFVPNKDIISGRGIRLKQQSGLNILASPFNFKVKEQKQLLSIIPKEKNGVIVTTLYQTT